MLVKIFGLIDFLAALGLLMLKFDVFGSFALIFGLIVLFKSLIFLDVFMTTMDVLTFLMILLAFFGIFNIFTWLAFFWLIYKTVVSLI